MAKSVHDNVLDAALNYIKNNATRLVLTEGDPGASYSDANTDLGSGSGKKIADVTISGASFTGPANGTTSGRKLTVNAQAGVDVDITDNVTAPHVALLDVANSAVLYVTTAAAVNVDASGTVDIGSWVIEIADPA